jgi:tRNA A37 threonylcarbamoyladenosine synthetase subunit TsaC/SUA5/YrdC
MCGPNVAKAKTNKWTGENDPEAMEVLKKDGGVVVSPTKVGYIIVTTNKAGLERKFDIKERKRNKPGVVLCGSMEQLLELADLTPEAVAFYQKFWDADILMGCICPWKEEGKKYIPEDGSRELMMDTRSTSCFVIKFGVPSEKVAAQLWADSKTLLFASSANPSGKGNRGVLAGVGERIETMADLMVDADEYVASIQPTKTVETRYEQGVMVSLVDESGKLVPDQNGQRGISPCPVLIRKGLDVDKITNMMCEHYLSWDYRHGAYY